MRTNDTLRCRSRRSHADDCRHAPTLREIYVVESGVGVGVGGVLHCVIEFYWCFIYFRLREVQIVSESTDLRL